MADPTGLSGAPLGAVVAKLLDMVIIETKKVVYCKRQSRALRDVLEQIQPLVSIACKNVSTCVGGTSVPVLGLGPIEKWLNELQSLLDEAECLVLECLKLKGTEIIQRYKMGTKISAKSKQIAEICAREAPFASLGIVVVAAHGVHKILEELARLSVNVENISASKHKSTETTGEHLEEILKRAKATGENVDKLLKLVETTREPPEKGIVSLTDSPTAQTSCCRQNDPGKGFGMDLPLAELRRLLLDETANTKWVGICGMGGLGKTRLANAIYCSRDISNHFPERFWLTIGQKPSIEGLQEELGVMLQVDTRSTDKEQARTRLCNALREKKALLVLDDVWNDGFNVLNYLDVTSGSKTGSKILVTTRHMKVLQKKGAIKTRVTTLKTLNAGDSLGLFCEWAFEGDHSIPPQLGRRLVEDVVNECKGLPLALKVIAGALGCEPSPAKWRIVLKKLQEGKTWDEDQDGQIYNSLQLSYDALMSDELKKCFIYFAAFPEDSDVTSETLVNLWAGEKLFQAGGNTDDDMDPMEEGYEFLDELIGRSLIELQGQHWSRALNRFTLTCRIHDVLRDFALRLIEKGLAPLHMKCLFGAERRLKTFPEKWLEGPCPTSQTTHMALNKHSLKSLPTEISAPKLEVFLLAAFSAPSWSPKWKWYNTQLFISPGFLESFLSMKVLDLHNVSIFSLPETLGNLKNLIYLDLSETGLWELPVQLEKLTKLEYLSLQNCMHVEPWPFDISCLKKLSTLNTKGCKVIWGPRHDTGLHIQVDNNISQSLCDSLNSLCSLTNLQNLSITGDQEYLPNEFSSLVNLRYLQVSFWNLKELPPTLHTSNVPKLSKLYYFSLAGCESLCELPEWIVSLSRLCVLDLMGCSSLLHLPHFHKLQKLKHLELSSCSRLQQLLPACASRGHFPSLEELILNDCEGLQHFPSVEQGAFPQLQKLHLSRCCSLVELPSTLTANGAFPSLQKLKLDMCKGLQHFPSVAQGAFPQLQELDLSRCCSLVELPSTFATNGTFPSLQKLKLDKCEGLRHFPSVEQGAFPQLQELDLSGCCSLVELPSTFVANGVFPSLQRLYIQECKGLQHFPSIEQGIFPELRELDLSGCCNLVELPSTFASKGAFPSLEGLSIQKCKGLQHFPSIEHGAFPELRELDLSGCCNLVELPSTFAANGAFPNLRSLYIQECKGLQHFPFVEEGAFPQLQDLYFSGCCNLVELPSTFASKGAFPSLQELKLDECQGLQHFPSIEQDAFPQLRELDLSGCCSLVELPSTFAANGVFSSLRRLNIKKCKGLQHFPSVEQGAFPHVQELSLSGCCSLVELPSTFAANGAFPNLRRLFISECELLQHFPSIEEGAFPQLQILDLSGCCKLEFLSTTISKGDFPSLQVLKTFGCKGLEHLHPIKEGA